VRQIRRAETVDDVIRTIEFDTLEPVEEARAAASR
jgi:hypothetical protein